ncbi:10 kDa chaperonin [Streptomyces californicus]
MSTTSSKVAIKPLEDRIVVQPLDAEQTTASGLVIPDTAKEKPQEGVVLAVGPGRFENGERYSSSSTSRPATSSCTASTAAPR